MGRSSLTVAAMGIWLLVFEKRRLWCVCPNSWDQLFLIASQVIIPFFSGSEAAAVGRYSHLGIQFWRLLAIWCQARLILGE